MKVKVVIVLGMILAIFYLENHFNQKINSSKKISTIEDDVVENNTLTSPVEIYTLAPPVEKKYTNNNYFYPTDLSSSEEKEAWRSRMGVTIDESAKDNYRAYSDEILLALMNEQQDVLAMSVYADRIMHRTGPIDEEYKEFLLLMTKMGSLEGLGRLQILTSVCIEQSLTNPTNDDYFNEKYQQDIAELVGYTLVSAELGNKHFAIRIADYFLKTLNINNQEISMSKVQNLKTALLNEIQTFRYARGLDELTDTRSEGQKASDNYIYEIVKKKLHYNDIWGY